MPLNTSKPEKNWQVEIPSLDKSGKSLFGADGKKLMKKVRMAPRVLADGTPQSFYFPEAHEAAGCFKEMRIILEERGLGDQIHDLKHECPKFHCPPVIALFFTLIFRLFSQPCHSYIRSPLSPFPCYPCFHAIDLLFD